MGKKTLGLVMIVKNEGRCLERCLSLAKELADGIYITDTGSADDFAAARNYALAQSPCDWNLVLDADEYLVYGTKRELLDFIERGSHVGAIQRIDSYPEADGRVGQSYTYPARLIPRGTFYEGRVHEQIVSPLPIAPLPLVFEHDGYLQGGKGERNLGILLKQLEEDPEDAYTLYQTARTLWLMKEYGRADGYFERFYRKAPPSGTGYRVNGVISYIYNLLELKKYEKGLRVIEAEKGRLHDYADYHFACGTFYMQAILSDVKKYAGYLPRIEAAYLRCLDIGEAPEQEGVRGNGSFKAAYNLGVWYEVSGAAEKALACYRHSFAAGYEPAGSRIEAMEGREQGRL